MRFRFLVYLSNDIIIRQRIFNPVQVTPPDDVFQCLISETKRLTGVAWLQHYIFYTEWLLHQGQVTCAQLSTDHTESPVLSDS